MTSDTNPSPEIRDWRAEADAVVAAEQERLGGRQLGAPSERHITAGSQSALVARMAERRDASTTMLCSATADLFILLHPYRAGRPMDAWLTGFPLSGQLELSLIIAPTWPDSTLGGISPDEQYREWAASNVYSTRTVLPGETLVGRYDVTGNPVVEGALPAVTKPRFATALPIGQFDVTAFHGQTIQVEAWAEGSAGVAGYVERRRTVLHL